MQIERAAIATQREIDEDADALAEDMALAEGQEITVEELWQKMEAARERAYWDDIKRNMTVNGTTL
jgi:hypothetical protein